MYDNEANCAKQQDQYTARAGLIEGKGTNIDSLVGQLDLQQKMIEGLVQEIDYLRDALEPVMAPASPAEPAMGAIGGDGNRLTPVPISLSPACSRIESHSTRITNAMNRIRTLRQGLRL